MLQFKSGVVLLDLQPQMLLAIWVAENEYDERGVPLVITSVNDSKHGAFSRHYKGLAVDLRTHNLPSYDKKPIFEALQRILSPVGFDVLWESRGEVNEHYHIEYDPKPGRGLPPEGVLPPAQVV